MKKVILGVFVLMMAVSLTGCGETKQEKAVDDFTKKIEDLDKDMTREMKKAGEEIKKGEEKTRKEVESMKNSKNEKSAAEKLEETKDLKKCLTKAAAKSSALDCYRTFGNEDFKDGDAAATNLGIDEWTPEDKQRSLKQTDMIISMLQMQVTN